MNAGYKMYLYYELPKFCNLKYKQGLQLLSFLYKYTRIFLKIQMFNLQGNILIRIIYIRYYFFISLRCFQKTSKLDKVQRYAYFYLLCTFQVLTKDSFTFFPCYIKINNIHKSRGAPLYICIMYVLNRSNAEQESSSVTSQLFDHDVSVVVCLD